MDSADQEINISELAALLGDHNNQKYASSVISWLKRKLEENGSDIKIVPIKTTRYKFVRKV